MRITTAKTIEPKNNQATVTAGASRKQLRLLSPSGKIFRLHKQYGNNVVQRMYETGILQAKLRIGRPNDVYELEADRVGEQVVSMPDSVVGGRSATHGKSAADKGSGSIQKKPDCPSCRDEESIRTKPLPMKMTPLVRRRVEEEKDVRTQPEEEEELKRQPEEEEEIQREVEDEEEEPMQAKVESSNTPEITTSVEGRINSLKGGGSPMPERLRAYFEPRFGFDFGQVRLHTDSRAADVAGAVNAQAFTLGNNIVFGSSRFSPETGTGKKLLAHELTHVIQQQDHEIKPSLISKNGPRDRGNVVRRWLINGNEAKSNKKSDTLWGLSKKLTGSGMSWPCIRPTSMKSKKAKGKNYYLFVRRGDKFDVSNLILRTGPSVNLRLVRPADGYYERAVSMYYNGTYTSDPEADIEAAAEYGKKPIHNLILTGHTGGTLIWGSGANWDVVASNPAKPDPTKGQAENGMFPRRCWFTRNAQVRIVGCCSQTVAGPFARAFLRKGAEATGTTEGICGVEEYIQVPLPVGGPMRVPTSHYMTFDRSCAPACPWPPPPTAHKCYSAACMNNQRTKWKTFKGRL